MGRPAQLQQPAATVLTEWDGLKLEGIKLDRGRPLHSGANSDEYYLLQLHQQRSRDALVRNASNHDEYVLENKGSRAQRLWRAVVEALARYRMHILRKCGGW